jgi:glycosyltransferase involved in cell wall biosynthesis
MFESVIIVLPVYNRQSLTDDFCKHLMKQSFSDFRLLLVDDGCSDDTVKLYKHYIPSEKLSVIETGGDKWWGGSLAFAQEYLRSSCQKYDLDNTAVLIINDDVCFARDYIQSGVECLNRDPKSILFSQALNESTGDTDYGVHFNRRKMSFKPCKSGETPNCLSTRGLMLSLHLFIDKVRVRPKYFPHYLSDYDYTIRLLENYRVQSSALFTLTYNDNFTGFIGYETKLGPSHFLSRTFDLKSKSNPITWTNMFWLHGGVWGILPLFKLWASLLIYLCMSIVRRTMRNA